MGGELITWKRGPGSGFSEPPYLSLEANYINKFILLRDVIHFQRISPKGNWKNLGVKEREGGKLKL